MRYCLDIFKIISKTSLDPDILLDPGAQFMHGVEGHFSTGGGTQSRTALVYCFDMLEIRYSILASFPKSNSENPPVCVTWLFTLASRFSISY